MSSHSSDNEEYNLAFLYGDVSVCMIMFSS